MNGIPLKRKERVFTDPPEPPGHHDFSISDYYDSRWIAINIALFITVGILDSVFGVEKMEMIDVVLLVCAGALSSPLLKLSSDLILELVRMK